MAIGLGLKCVSCLRGIWGELSNGVDLRAAAGVRREQEIESKLLYAAYSRLPLNMWLTLICTLLFVPLLWRFFSV